MATPTYEEVTFTTHFGDYLHGLFITWTSTPSADAGSSDITMSLQMNLRSKLHVYGYTGTYFSTDNPTGDVAEDWDYFYDYVETDTTI